MNTRRYTTTLGLPQGTTKAQAQRVANNLVNKRALLQATPFKVEENSIFRASTWDVRVELNYIPGS